MIGVNSFMRDELENTKSTQKNSIHRKIGLGIYIIFAVIYYFFMKDMFLDGTFFLIVGISSNSLTSYNLVVTQSGIGKTVKELATLVEESFITSKGISKLTQSEVNKINNPSGSFSSSGSSSSGSSSGSTPTSVSSSSIDRSSELSTRRAERRTQFLV